MTTGNEGGRDAAAGETRGTEDLSRRNLVVNLLGFAAGGLALEVLGGCANGGSPGQGPDIAEIAQNATGTVLAWADTVLGTPPPSSGTWTRTGDLATNTSADLNNAVVVIAMNALTPGTRIYGGGGVFYWDAAGGTDDGGTIIVPNSSGTGFGTNGPCWRRIYSGPLDVKWFGAKGDGTADDWAAIQNAIKLISNYVGGTVLLPYTSSGYLIKSAIAISSRSGIIIEGAKGQPIGHDLFPQLIWGGSSGGTMISMTDPLDVTLRNLDIDGKNTADYGVYVTQSHGGWGHGSYEHLGISGCAKNAWRFDGAAATDGGGNHFKRCTFRGQHAATGTHVDDACFAYTGGISNVQDVFDHCAWIYVEDVGGTTITGTYAIYVESGTPRIQIHNSYTKADTGIAALTGARFTLSDHYSEDVDFVNLPDVDVRQVLRNCAHVGAGTSVVWGGSGTSGYPLLIDGGDYKGNIDASATDSPLVLANDPIVSGIVTTLRQASVVRIGRPGNYSTAAVGAINATGFAPTVYANLGVNLNPSLASGDVLMHTLSQNTIANAPAAVDATWDVGRVHEFHITGDPSTTHTITWNAIYKFAGGAYTHSGAGNLDILRFRYDGTNWVEISRSVDVR